MHITSVDKRIEIVFDVEIDSEDPGSWYRRSGRAWYKYTDEDYESTSCEEEDELERLFIQYMRCENRTDEL